MNVSSQKTPEDGAITILQGIVADQATLHGILSSVRDLGLPLIEVVYLPAIETEIQGK